MVSCRFVSIFASMKLLSLIVCLVVASKKKCKTHQWEQKGKCTKMVGFALENKQLPKQAVTFAKKFYDYLDEEKIYKTVLRLNFCDCFDKLLKRETSLSHRLSFSNDFSINLR